MTLYRLFFIVIFIQLSTCVSAQSITYFEPENRKGQFYVYWGWNLDAYSKSDIHFTGADYDFTLDNVVALDRQSDFDVKLYCNPLKATIPQYNFRVGYFINEHYNISFGIDHMKYVVKEWQKVLINGQIDQTETIYDGNYVNDNIIIKPDFLSLEHTDGLNYINSEFRRVDNLIATKHIKVNFMEGFGAGILLPKTNCTLINNERYDEFHLAGFGLGGMVGLNTEFFRYFFLQSELKGGFINMPDIRTTENIADKASQQFFFAQWNVTFGVNFNLNK